MHQLILPILKYGKEKLKNILEMQTIMKNLLYKNLFENKLKYKIKKETDNLKFVSKK